RRRKSPRSAARPLSPCPTSFIRRFPMTCAMGRRAVPVGSGRGEILEFNGLERAHEAVHCRFCKARAEHALVSGEVRPRGGRRTSLAAAWRVATAGIERFLLQALRFKLNRFDLGAECLLLAGFDYRRGAFEFAADFADRNDGAIAPAPNRLV